MVTRGRLFVSFTLGFVVPLILIGQTPAAQTPQNVFKSGVNVVSLNVTVTDASNRYVMDLTDQDFSVYEDGIRQDQILFNRTNLPIALSLLVDTSSSMENRIGMAQEAAVGFVHKLRPSDLGEVIGFDSHVEVLQKFTANPQQLEEAIRKTVAGGSTALYNALYISLRELQKIPRGTVPEEVRRQAIIVLTDGEDTSSLVPFDEVQALARRSGIAIYPIGLLADEPNAGKGVREAIFSLRQLAAETGGRAFFPTDAKALSMIYGQIYDELSSQYTLGYMSKNSRRDGVWHSVTVRVSRPSAIARTKQGYFAPTGTER
jgi:Ca-activated chloride channel family protein